MSTHQPREDGDNGDVRFILQVNDAQIPVLLLRSALATKYQAGTTAGEGLKSFLQHRAAIEDAARLEWSRGGGPFDETHPLMIVHL